MNIAFFSKFPEYQQLLTETRLRCVGITDNPLATHGQAFGIPIEIERVEMAVDFLIVEMKDDVLLGLDFCKQYQVKLDMEKKDYSADIIIEILGPMDLARSSDEVVLLSTQDTDIMPHTGEELKCRVVTPQGDPVKSGQIVIN